MGTDIHFYVERRQDAAWISCDSWEPYEYPYDGQEPFNTVRMGKHFYDNRNYDVFAILADVRNGSGFAGVDTGDGFVPVAQPRGLPDDLSPELRAEADHFLEHTPSWVTVQELMDYDWTRVTIKRGVVNAQQFARWRSWRRRNGLGPESWSGGVWGKQIRTIDETEMERLVAAEEERVRAECEKTQRPLYGDAFHAAVAARLLPGLHCQISWNVPYYRAASDFLSECLPRLWRLGAPADVRCVFWFDS